MKKPAFPHIQTRLESLREEITNTEIQYGRKKGSTELLAVSKTRSIDEVRLAIQAGQRHFGENYLQDAITKISALTDENLCWHFIGPLQSNKCKSVAEYFDWVHTIDRLKIAERLNSHRSDSLSALNICIQINISGETSKSGINPEETSELADKIAGLENINLRGLMALPAPETDFQAQREAFAKVRQIFEGLQQEHPQLDTLSLGTTNDMQAAIAEGSTMVRIGTAIFGPRNQ